MKKTKTVSAILFGVLFVMQTFLMSYVLLGMGVSNAPFYFIIEIAAIVVFALLCVKLFKNDEPITYEFKREIAVATVLYLIFTALCYQLQLSAIIQALSTLNPSWAASVMPSAVAFGIKVLLLVSAAVFAMMEPKVTEVTLEFEEAKDVADFQTEEAVEEVIVAIDEQENI
ncbi:MAG: hypothetical protein RR349_03775 [Oscillospiraceae bacterium]